MANRIPLIVNPDVSQIQELPASDTLFIANGVDVNGSMDISTNLTLSSTATASTRFVVSATTASTNATSGCATFAGGVGISGALNVGGTLGVTGNSTFTGNIDVDGTANLDNVDIDGTFKIGSGETVDIIRDEDDLSSNDANALATQQSIKAYVDNFGRIKQIKEATSTAASTFNTTTFTDKVSLTVSGVAANSRVMVIASYSLESATPFTSGNLSQGRCIKDGGSFEGEEIINSHNNYASNGGKQFNILYDSANGAGDRTYKIQARRLNNQAVIISNAKILAIELAIS